MPHREAAATASRFAALTRRGWLLWCVTFLLLIALYFFFQYTRMGLAMRAAASLPE